MIMGYDSKIHHRHSIRLKGYDYSQEGLYFITLCVQNKECLFGHIIDNHMDMNEAGKIVEKWVKELKNKYPNIEFGEYVVMPNHFHCIISIGACNNLNHGELVGAPLCGRPLDPTINLTIDATITTPIVEPFNITTPDHHPTLDKTNKYGMHNKKYNATINNMMDWFKTMTTNEYIRGVKTMGWLRFDGKLWQRNYWEHIIRNQQSYENISNYIIENPARWKEDKLFMP